MSPESPERPRTPWRRRAWRSVLVVLTLAALAVATEATRQSLSHTEEKQSFPGVGNFGRVNARLWRGAQPSSAGLQQLKAQGVDIVVSFTLEGEAHVAEQREVEGLGMRYVGIPWSTRSVPTADQVATFLGVIRDSPDARVFLHCKQGADRTGVMVAIYRLAVDRWTADQAVSEMEAFHHYWFLLPHLERFVRTWAPQPGA